MSDNKDNIQDTEKHPLQDIANIAGKSGLYRIVKPGRSGVIIETLDDNKERSLAAASAKVSILKDVSVYVEHDESVPLADVFHKIRNEYGEELPFDPKKSSEQELRDAFAEVLPNYARSKVYFSDMKKIFSWYVILSGQLAGFFEDAKAGDEGHDTEEE